MHYKGPEIDANSIFKIAVACFDGMRLDLPTQLTALSGRLELNSALYLTCTVVTFILTPRQRQRPSERLQRDDSTWDQDTAFFTVAPLKGQDFAPKKGKERHKAKNKGGHKGKAKAKVRTKKVD